MWFRKIFGIAPPPKKCIKVIFLEKDDKIALNICIYLFTRKIVKDQFWKALSSTAKQGFSSAFVFSL